MDFLTLQERQTLRTIREDKFELVGQINLHEKWEQGRWDSLRKAFADYPVQWVNSKDRLYQLPYEDDFLTALSKERAKREQENAGEGTQRRNLNQEPWTYQEGMIFKARLMKETPKALLVRMRGFGTFWVPKSQVDFMEPHLWLPEWLMKDKGLTTADADASMNPPFEWEPALIPKTKGVGE